MNPSIFSFSFILFLHFSKVGTLKFEVLKYERTKLSSIIQANIIKQCYFTRNEWKLWIQISRRVVRINEFLEVKGNDDESMNFIWKTVSRIVSSRWGNNRCERLAKVFLKFERTNFLGPRRGKVANSWAKFCNDSRRWEVCTGRDIGWKGLVLKRGGASFIRNAFPVARTIRILIVSCPPPLPEDLIESCYNALYNRLSLGLNKYFGINLLLRTKEQSVYRDAFHSVDSDHRPTD